MGLKDKKDASIATAAVGDMTTRRSFIQQLDHRLPINDPSRFLNYWEDHLGMTVCKIPSKRSNSFCSKQCRRFTVLVV